MNFQSNSNQNYQNLQESNVKTLSDIQQLQKIEKDLFSNLEQNISQNILTDEKKLELVNKINDISQMRINLYQTIKGVNTFHESNLNTASDTLSEQITAVSIVENELNEAKKRLEKIEEYKTNKLRLVEINNYYSERYSQHSKIMKTIIFMFVPILILTILMNKGLLPSIIFSVLTIIIGVVGTIRIWYLVSSAMSRDNMNYQEYNWNFNPDTASKNIVTPSKKTRGNFKGPGICVGEACCDAGYTYDMVKNKCIPTSQIGNDNKNISSFLLGAYASKGASKGASANAMKNNWGGAIYSNDIANYTNAYVGDNVSMYVPSGSPGSGSGSGKEGFSVGKMLTKYTKVVTEKKPDYTMGDKPQPIYAST
jgi:hypothetical protein